MKLIFLQLCIVCFAFTVRAQETKNPQLPPVRTSDPQQRRTAVQPSLPLRSGDNVQQRKHAQSAAVPLRKTDAAPVNSSAGHAAQDKTTRGKTAAVVLPSSLSGKEALDQRRQAVQPPAEVAPRQ